jgi:hypothetical protein
LGFAKAELSNQAFVPSCAPPLEPPPPPDPSLCRFPVSDFGFGISGFELRTFVHTTIARATTDPRPLTLLRSRVSAFLWVVALPVEYHHRSCHQLPSPLNSAGFGYRILGFGFQVSVFGVQISGFGFRILRFGFRVSDFGFRISSFGVQASGFESRNPGGSGFRVQVQGFRVQGAEPRV